MTKKNIYEINTPHLPQKKETIIKKTPKKKRNNEKETTKKHVCVLNALASYLPDARTPPTSDASTTHSRQSYVSSSRADNTGRDGKGRDTTRCFLNKKRGPSKKEVEQFRLGHKDSWNLGNHGKTNKKRMIGSWKLFVKEKPSR